MLTRMFTANLNFTSVCHVCNYDPCGWITHGCKHSCVGSSNRTYPLIISDHAFLNQLPNSSNSRMTIYKGFVKEELYSWTWIWYDHIFVTCVALLRCRENKSAGDSVLQLGVIVKVPFHWLRDEVQQLSLGVCGGWLPHINHGKTNKVINCE